MSLYHGYRFEEGSISDYADVIFHYRLGMHMYTYICARADAQRALPSCSPTHAISIWRASYDD